MAPEVLQKQPHSKASDMYAFAITLNELASQSFPFSDCTKDNPEAHTVLEMGYGRCAGVMQSGAGGLVACWIMAAASAAVQGVGFCVIMSNDAT